MPRAAQGTRPQGETSHTLAAQTSGGTASIPPTQVDQPPVATQHQAASVSAAPASAASAPAAPAPSPAVKPIAAIYLLPK
ncbi:hypothetical protein U1Q18_039089, partial [Sarracenia purpurea var. burkii]